ncbi:MAG: Rne/Rng family ribonuclease [Candidatus Marinimicrobia bacterium]|nr:Rne/Rng family ribonuclease [Candidatus Neomarinimicrobiota bacterium]
MKKKILISRTSSETRSAILEDNKLINFFVERPEETRMVGNIYKGKVENVIKGIKAAFIDIGREQNAFLPFSEISDMNKVKSIMADIKKGRDWEYKWHSSDNNNRIDLKSGKEILIQVIKEPFRQKGARVTTDITIPGRFLVLVPFANYIGISKNIKNKGERKRLKKIIGSLKPKGYGVIVRTVAESKGQKTLKNDLDYLVKTWKSTKRRAAQSEVGTPVFKDMGSASSVIRDFLTSDVEEIAVDNKKLYKKVKKYLQFVSPNFIDRLIYYNNSVPMFDKYGVKKELDKALRKKIWLKNGGFIVIEHTEAMTTVDVNSGKCVSRNKQEQISTKTNLLAARETARQLNLRDIGGLIVIDFIHMDKNRNKKKIYDELKKELSRAKAKVALSRISKFGLLEMTRERTGENLTYTISDECPVCHGSGRIPSKASLVTKIENWFRRFSPDRKTGRVLFLHIHPELAHHLNETNKHFFRKLQLKNLIRLKVKEDITLNIDSFRVITKKGKKDITDQY